MRHIAKALFAASLAGMIPACGSGGSGSAEINSGSGSLHLAVTDAPINLENADVVVTFAGIEVKPAEGDSVTFNIDPPQEIVLSDLQGGDSAVLLQGVSLEAGRYNWIRIGVLAERNTLDSYIVFKDQGNATYSLFVPSGAQSGLKLNRPFTVASAGVTSFTVDFELDKSIVKPNGQDDYQLKPVLRIVATDTVGTVSGAIDASLLAGENCSAGARVYGFAGTFGGAELEDAWTADDDPARPLTSAAVQVDGSSGSNEYHYAIGFLEPGDYTLALTCDADLDDPELDDEPSTVQFIDPILQVSVSDGATVTADFSL